MKINHSLQELKYPIGDYVKPSVISSSEIKKWIEVIASFPKKISEETSHLNDEQLNTPYRDGGWSIRQVVHHCADSHMNSLCRFKLALTEELPTIRPYFENRWAELSDSSMAIEPALKMIEGIHTRWVFLLNSLNETDLERKFFHPEHKREIELKEVIAQYAWHCNHHLAHISGLKMRMGWS